MKNFIVAVLIATLTMFSAVVSADARQSRHSKGYGKHHHEYSYTAKKHHKQKQYAKASKKKSGKRRYNDEENVGYNDFSPRHHAGAKPGKWCGWYMRRIFGGDERYNVARNWAKRGRATNPRVGAVVVWPHHVGVIVGKSRSGGWLVKSGNTAGGRVAVQNRRISNAIAFRMVD